MNITSIGRIAGLAALVALAVIIGGFSLFVGYHKVFSPLEELAQHDAWTAHLPIAVGRIIGALELIAATVLICALPFPRLARVGTVAAIWITLNHAVATVVHVIYQEHNKLPQSAVSIALCLTLVALYARRARQN